MINMRFLILAGLILQLSMLSAQELTVEDYRTSFDLTSLKNTDNALELKVEFSASNRENKKEIINVKGAEVAFYNILGDQENLLGKSITDLQGIAVLVLKPEQKLLADEDGYYTVVARYEGNDKMDYEESELMLKDLQLELEVIEDDGLRTLVVNAFTIDEQGEKVAVEELDLKLGVQGMLSRLVLDESILEGGTYEFEVPDDVHGNADGHLTFFAFVEDHMDYGNVYVSKTINDSEAVKSIPQEKNKLWTNAAPVWMYVVLSLMLLGVWANYLYAVRNLLKIWKTGKN